MSNLKQEIQALEQNREDIVTAIQDKGGTIADSAPLKDIPQAIEALPSGGDGDWELLVDNTTTSEIAAWRFTQGDNGQVFNEYKEILVFFQCQPAAKASYLRLCWSGDNAWSSRPCVGFASTSTSITTLGLARLEHTPLGIVASFLKSYNNSTLSGDLSYASGSSLNWTTLQASNQATTTYPFDSEIKYITLGSYQAVIGVGSRIIVYGKK